MSLQRHKAIVPLSRHHHHALALVLKIRKAGPEAGPETVEALKRELQHFWETGGQQHFREEEEILLPAYARYADIDRREIVEMLLEHVKIRSLVGSIESAKDDALPLIRELGDLLEKHVRLEERVIFPLIEAAIPEAMLMELAPYFHEGDAGCRL
jgi:hemerythrin-like domain-containing protein